MCIFALADFEIFYSLFREDGGKRHSKMVDRFGCNEPVAASRRRRRSAAQTAPPPGTRYKGLEGARGTDGRAPGPTISIPPRNTPPNQATPEPQCPQYPKHK